MQHRHPGRCCARRHSSPIKMRRTKSQVVGRAGTAPVVPKLQTIRSFAIAALEEDASHSDSDAGDFQDAGSTWGGSEASGFARACGGWSTSRSSMSGAAHAPTLAPPSAPPSLPPSAPSSASASPAHQQPALPLEDQQLHKRQRSRVAYPEQEMAAAMVMGQAIEQHSRRPRLPSAAEDPSSPTAQRYAMAQRVRVHLTPSREDYVECMLSITPMFLFGTESEALQGSPGPPYAHVPALRTIAALTAQSVAEIAAVTTAETAAASILAIGRASSSVADLLRAELHVSNLREVLAADNKFDAVASDSSSRVKDQSCRKAKEQQSLSKGLGGFFKSIPSLFRGANPSPTSVAASAARTAAETPMIVATAMVQPAPSDHAASSDHMAPSGQAASSGYLGALHMPHVPHITLSALPHMPHIASAVFGDEMESPRDLWGAPVGDMGQSEADAKPRVTQDNMGAALAMHTGDVQASPIPEASAPPPPAARPQVPKLILQEVGAPATADAAEFAPPQTSESPMVTHRQHGARASASTADPEAATPMASAVGALFVVAVEGKVAAEGGEGAEASAGEAATKAYHTVANLVVKIVPNFQSSGAVWLQPSSFAETTAPSPFPEAEAGSLAPFPGAGSLAPEHAAIEHVLAGLMEDLDVAEQDPSSTEAPGTASKKRKAEVEVFPEDEGRWAPDAPSTRLSAAGPLPDTYASASAPSAASTPSALAASPAPPSDVSTEVPCTPMPSLAPSAEVIAEQPAASTSVAHAPTPAQSAPTHAPSAGFIAKQLAAPAPMAIAPTPAPLVAAATELPTASAPTSAPTPAPRATVAAAYTDLSAAPTSAISAPAAAPTTAFTPEVTTVPVADSAASIPLTSPPETTLSGSMGGATVVHVQILPSMFINSPRPKGQPELPDRLVGDVHKQLASLKEGSTQPTPAPVQLLPPPVRTQLACGSTLEDKSVKRVGAGPASKAAPAKPAKSLFCSCFAPRVNV